MAQLIDYRYGRMTPVVLADGDGQQFKDRDEYLTYLEGKRREGAEKRRLYYDGNQYDLDNLECLSQLTKAAERAGGYAGEKELIRRAISTWNRSLPEHYRLHAYSTALQESVDFIANRLSNKARITVKDKTAAQVVAAALDHSPELSGTEDDDEITLVNVIRDTCKVGDVPVLMRWDAEAETVWPDFWDSEMVELRFRPGRPDQVIQAIVEQVDWLVPPGESEVQQVEIKRVWQVEALPRVGGQRVTEEQLMQALEVGLAPGEDITREEECVESVYLMQSGEADVLLERITWGVPFVPWTLLRGDKKSLRATRGEALITDQAMATADRFNAVEQVAFIIARYNSHASLAVSGDAAALMQANDTEIHRDVADVMTFPGATELQVLSLPTDPQMIEHQRQVLLDGMYGAMGLTRVDQSSLESLGGVTGYALEILNTKSDGTFQRVRNQLTRDLKRMLNMILDCFAYWSQGEVGLEAELAELLADEDGMLPPEPGAGYTDIDPEAMFPNRAMEVVLGTGYVVDDAKTRDDFVAKLISQQEALRQRGYTDPEIKKIMDEQIAAAELVMAQMAQAMASRGSEGTSGSGSESGGEEGSSSTKAGKTTSSTLRGGQQEGEPARAGSSA